MFRRRRSRNREFPELWQSVLSERLQWWPLPDAGQRASMESHVLAFHSHTRFEGTKGFTTSEEITVTIAAEACRLVAGLDLDWYRDVTTVIVNPSIAVVRGERHIGGGIATNAPTEIAGEAMLHGPVLIAWDQAELGVRHPEFGHNVVYHEFAHKIDMADGAATGTPIQPDKAAYERWQSVMDGALSSLHNGHLTGIDTYGATNPSEFFAVVTEAFFDVPQRLRKNAPAVYEILRDFYHQDPASD